MTLRLFPNSQLPAERASPGTGLVVLVLHLGLLWVANLYWPLQVAVQSVVVQIFHSDATLGKGQSDTTSASTSDTVFARSPGSISSQRAGRAAMELTLSPPSVTAQQSTPLLSTQQTSLSKPLPAAASAPPVPVAPLTPVPAVPPVPVRSGERPVPDVAVPLLPAEEKAVDTRVTPAPQTPTVATPVAAPVPAPAPTPAPASLPMPALTPVPAAALVSPPVPSAPSVAPPVPVPAVVSAPAPAAVISAPPVAPTVLPGPAPAAVPSPAAAVAPSGAPANAPGTPAVGPTGVPGAMPSAGLAGGTVLVPAPGPTVEGLPAPLNLRLPPRYIFRPPLAASRRSLSELANEQLRRKPRDPFAEAVEGAANIDCLRDTPEGPAQGLLAIGPLLKRAIEERCRK